MDRQQADPQSLWHQTRRLLALRAAHPALRTGRFETLHVDEHQWVLRRVLGTDTVWAAFNLGPHTVRHPLPTTAVVGDAALSVQGAKVEGEHAVLTPWSALILPLPHGALA